MQLSGKQNFAFFGIRKSILGVDIVPGVLGGGGGGGGILCYKIIVFYIVLIKRFIKYNINYKKSDKKFIKIVL